MKEEAFFSHWYVSLNLKDIYQPTVGEIDAPIRQMELEHDNAGDALRILSSLTKRYTPPVDVCNTYKAMLEGLQELEKDLHMHIHKENNILFPRVFELTECHKN